jgi:GNAT superfamily N-acetyltransferase
LIAAVTSGELIAASSEIGSGIGLRNAADSDAAFLLLVFATARTDAPLLAQWPEVERIAFVQSQYQFQDIHYRRYYDGAEFLVIEHAGSAAGRLILHRTAADWLVLDIAFLPDLRGQGLGLALMRWLLGRAKDAGAGTVSLSVEIGNRARVLYERLGFTVTEDAGSHLEMVREL